MVKRPDGYHTVNPYIFCDQPNALAQFLETAFDAEEKGRTEYEGRIANLELRIGDAMMMLSQSDERYPAMPTAFYIYVENADQSMERAVAAGATLEMEVMDMSYGDRQGGVRDINGNIWWISQRLVDEDYH